jgi:hypothetical protein
MLSYAKPVKSGEIIFDWGFHVFQSIKYDKHIKQFS